MMTPARQRMVEDMRLRNFSPHTQTAYIRAVAQFSKHLMRSPEQLTAKHCTGAARRVAFPGKHDNRPVGIKEVCSATNGSSTYSYKGQNRLTTSGDGYDNNGNMTLEADLKQGMALYRAGDLRGAIERLNAAIDVAPRSIEAHQLLGNAFKHSGRLREAIAAHRKVVELDPTSRNWSNLLYTLHFDPDMGPKALATEHDAWNRACVLPLLKNAAPPTRDWNPTRPLRIGYISPDFREHSVGRFILPLLSSHDRSQFRIYCYSDVRKETNVTQAFKQYADAWRSTAGLPDEQVARQIAGDQIDILVELTMHTEDNRMLTLARKPAPIQVSYLAYCSTTGSSAIDYRLSDPYLDPTDQNQPFYSEQTIRLQSYWCYADYYGDKPILPLPADVNGYVTFGCLNNFGKASAPARRAWGAILQRAPNARLLLYCQPGAHREQLLAEFAAWGIAANRIQFVGFQMLHDYLATYAQIDISLDPFPYPGGTTSCDALWMGVPLVTLAGQTALSRGGASVLMQIGHPELIATSADEYVAIATKLAGDHPQLREFRAGLRQQMLRSRLMDVAAFTRDFESLLRQMWRTYCQRN
jgi:protein O-GlcNAc transferase